VQEDLTVFQYYCSVFILALRKAQFLTQLYQSWLFARYLLFGTYPLHLKFTARQKKKQFVECITASQRARLSHFLIILVSFRLLENARGLRHLRVMRYDLENSELF